MSHRRLTPVPTETTLVLGKELQMLPSISESTPDKPHNVYENSMEALSSSDEKMDSVEGSSKDTMVSDDLPVSTNITSNYVEEQGATENNRKNEDHEPLVATQKTDYIKLHFSSNDLHEIGTSDEKKPYQYDEEFIAPIEDIKEALLAVVLVIFHVAWSMGVAFWHIGDGNLSAGHLTLAIVIVSGVLVQLAYFFNGNVHKRKIWQTSKLMWILFLIPCTLPIFMSISNVCFVAKEIQNKDYIRPRTNARMIFLLESLTLAFPQCIVQLCLLMEDYQNFPSVKGVVIGVGIFVLTLGITFARVRFDSAKRYDRYGIGLDRWIRYAVLWAGKVLWILTYCCVLIPVRILYGSDNYVAQIAAVAILMACFEIPVLISSIRSCQRFAAACLSIFFLLPQFMALISLVFWINVDTTIYDYNVGSCILGMFFWVESMSIMGWLLDRCTGREIDFISGYPHFFGNLFTKCCK